MQICRVPSKCVRSARDQIKQRSIYEIRNVTSRCYLFTVFDLIETAKSRDFSAVTYTKNYHIACQTFDTLIVLMSSISPASSL